MYYVGDICAVCLKRNTVLLIQESHLPTLETFRFGRVGVSSHYGEIEVFLLQGKNLVELWNNKLDIAAIPRGLIFIGHGEYQPLT